MAAVNEALRRNFAAIGCAGEVALTEVRGERPHTQT